VGCFRLTTGWAGLSMVWAGHGLPMGWVVLAIVWPGLERLWTGQGMGLAGPGYGLV
jgi:hypothetical protein